MGDRYAHAKLTASDGAPYNYLGSSVAISGDTIVVGAAGAYHAAYVFVKPAGGWTSGTQTAKLTASDGPSGTALASRLASPGIQLSSMPGTQPSRAVTSRAPSTSSSSPPAETAKLTAADVAADLRGLSLAISGDTVVAGARLDDVVGP